jgi:hypothetical protein
MPCNRRDNLVRGYLRGITSQRSENLLSDNQAQADERLIRLVFRPYPSQGDLRRTFPLRRILVPDPGRLSSILIQDPGTR